MGLQERAQGLPRIGVGFSGRDDTDAQPRNVDRDNQREHGQKHDDGGRGRQPSDAPAAFRRDPTTLTDAEKRGMAANRQTLPPTKQEAVGHLLIQLVQLWDEHQSLAFQSLSDLKGDDQARWVDVLRQINDRFAKGVRPALETLSEGRNLSDFEQSAINDFQSTLVALTTSKIEDDTVFRPAEREIWFHLLARVREIETIRNFLTGQGLSSAIDLLFAVVFIAVLFVYSPTLTLIVLASIPFYLVIAFLIRPVLRDKINERFNTGAASQQFLVESIFGIQTLKAAAVEPILRNEWEDRLAAYVKTSFQAVMLSNAGQNSIQYVSKATTALVLFFGAKAVIDAEMTVGALIAFYMIMNQATAPVLRLSQLWQDFQQVQISVQRLGDILNSPPESQRLANANLPAARGAIKVVDLSFRYRPDTAEAQPAYVREMSGKPCTSLAAPVCCPTNGQ
jgi:ABC-type multidrug transport system fused ATPase/permease subunit